MVRPPGHGRHQSDGERVCDISCALTGAIVGHVGFDEGVCRVIGGSDATSMAVVHVCFISIKISGRVAAQSRPDQRIELIELANDKP